VTDPIRIAIVGPGRIADGRLAPALARVDGARLWSVHSRDRERAAAFARRHDAASPTPAYDDLDEMLADPQLDAVVVSTPDRLHAAQSVAAARAGKHVLVEKPMCTDATSGRLMIDACAQAGVHLGVAYHLRWHAGLRELQRRVAEGALGRLRHARAQWTWRAPDAGDWRAAPDVGRWWSLAGVGTHCLDLLRWFLRPCGEVVGVRATTSHAVFGSPHDETAIVTLSLADGTTAELTSSVLFDSASRLEIYGERDRAICENVMGPHGTGSITLGGRPLEFERADPYRGELADFVAAIREGRPPEVDGHEGLRNVEILVDAVMGS
jgi:1,5-anhydro-D-fructose reductase (1,5-anhydro-D-mannitol-forming)